MLRGYTRPHGEAADVRRRGCRFRGNLQGQGVWVTCAPISNSLVLARLLGLAEGNRAKASQLTRMAMSQIKPSVQDRANSVKSPAHKQDETAAIHLYGLCRVLHFSRQAASWAATKYLLSKCAQGGDARASCYQGPSTMRQGTLFSFLEKGVQTNAPSDLGRFARFELHRLVWQVCKGKQELQSPSESVP